ncbi:MAG: hypothetical protein Greene041662_1076, partial [Candidatus Peregrinibacteria bacterium Greene0416_62]
GDRGSIAQEHIEDRRCASRDGGGEYHGACEEDGDGARKEKKEIKEGKEQKGFPCSLCLFFFLYFLSFTPS